MTWFVANPRGLPGRLQGQGRAVVRPRDTGGALVDPDMGSVFPYHDNGITRYGGELEPWDTVNEFPGADMIYLRLAWAYIEPEEGKFNWSIVGTRSQRWIAKGKQVTFQFTCYESPGRTPNATPEWVVRAGVSVYSDPPSNGRGSPPALRYEPDSDGPIFMDTSLASLSNGENQI